MPQITIINDIILGTKKISETSHLAVLGVGTEKDQNQLGRCLWCGGGAGGEKERAEGEERGKGERGGRASSEQEPARQSSTYVSFENLASCDHLQSFHGSVNCTIKPTLLNTRASYTKTQLPQQAMTSHGSRSFVQVTPKNGIPIKHRSICYMRAIVVCVGDMPRLTKTDTASFVRNPVHGGTSC